MKKLDKKQVPQFIALCVVTAGLSGYVVMHLVAPGPVSAGTRTAPAAPAAGHPIAASADPKPGMTGQAGVTAPGDTKTAAEAEAGTTDAPPPNPAMHDPFAVGYVDPATQHNAPALPAAPALPKLPGTAKMTASTRGFGAMPVSFPAAPALPGGLGSFPSSPVAAAPGLPSGPVVPALPVAPAAPVWTVTGVLQGATGKVAILRNGDARRIVRSGDFVDSTFRVTGVTRTSVILRHGTTYYHLTLGGAKAAPSTVPAAPVFGSPPPAAVPAPMPAAVMGSAIIPIYHTAQPKTALTHLRRQGPGLSLASGSLSVPHAAKTISPTKAVSPAKVASAISLGLRLLDGSVLAQTHKGH